MYELKKMLEPGPHLIKKNLPGRVLTKVEKHWATLSVFVLSTLYDFRTTTKSPNDAFPRTYPRR